MNYTVENWGRFLVDAVRDYAQQNNLNFELFSGDWIMRLEQTQNIKIKLGGPTAKSLSNSITKYLFGNDFGLNNTATRAICNDKSATYQVLTREGLPALHHEILLRPGSLGAPEDVFYRAKNVYNELGGTVICKPNNGSSGTDIVLVASEAELESTLQDLFITHRALTLSPFVAITAEYRVCVLAGAVELVYEKVRQEGALQHNLSHGATAQEITDEQLLAKLTTMALRAASALSGTFVHVDIIDVNGELLILEVNSGIMFEHYSLQSTENKNKATTIYHKALNILFKK